MVRDVEVEEELRLRRPTQVWCPQHHVGLNTRCKAGLDFSCVAGVKRLGVSVVDDDDPESNSLLVESYK